LTDDFRILPPRIRYFAGGDRSVRGYGFHELGREDEEGNVIGGETIAAASVEGEFWFLEKWGVAAFVDAGDADEGFPTSPRVGVGMGGRWLSPVGPVRLDVGRGLSRPEKSITIHLSIGPDL
jgi:translocation and assembly module TamA